jgi:LAO/AO transport system kinase
MPSFKSIQRTFSNEYVQQLFNGIIKRDRVCLSRAITLMESTLPLHALQATELLNALMQHHHKQGSSAKNTLRVGFAGPPGAGKSTLIETLGMHVLSRPCPPSYFTSTSSPSSLSLDTSSNADLPSIAVLAVDPSSQRSGGSLLGDKTRMFELTKSDRAFIRPSPSKCALGGLAAHTNDLILLCESAGFDTIFIETVGLGQSETVIDSAVDMTLLVVAPGAGDELQGVKRGIVEVADAIVVNKADGELMQAATHAAADYKRALQLHARKTPIWTPPVIPISCFTKSGIDLLWDECIHYHSSMLKSGALYEKRKKQGVDWTWAGLELKLSTLIRSSPSVETKFRAIRGEIEEGAIPPRQAADLLFDAFLQELKKTNHSDLP